MDYLFTYNSQFCYEISFTKNSYESFYLENCDNCQSCYFSSDLISCKNCLFCSGLNHKEYYILNEPYSKEEYFSKLKEYDLHSYSGLQKAQKFFETEFPRKFPRRAIYQVNCEDCVGDNLNNCKNAYQCFDCTNCQDIAYAVQIDEAYDSMDMTCMGYDRSEVCYETIGCSGIFNCLSCDSCWHNHDLFYCNTCFSTKSCFGCVSLQHKNYCILNKQYSKEEYKEVMKGIIEDMKKTHSTSSGSCDWGGFFPTDISPYAYNETIANEYYPLSKEEISLKGWNWKKEEDKLLDVTKTIPAGRLPDTIADIPDDVLNWAIKCEQTDRLFKIQKQELEFYRKFNLPLPHYHPDVRFQMRMVRRQPRKLFERKCTKCGIDIKTTYAPNRPETVYCENCYLKNVY